MLAVDSNVDLSYNSVFVGNCVRHREAPAAEHFAQ